MTVHVFTSITCNYLPKARVLAESVRRYVPGTVFHLVLVDRTPPGFRLDAEPFDSIIGVYDLGIPEPDQWIFQHSVVEACTAVKGFALRLLLAIPECHGVLYFDPDIVVLAPLEKLIARLGRSAVLLTPHMTEPETTLAAIQDNELAALQHGVYNLGFLGVGPSAEGRRFAEWWAHRLEHFCYDEIARGLFTDQRWADLASAYFESMEILRAPGYNVCTWNLSHRRVEGSLRGGFTVNGGPLYFYHFSGLDSGAQKAMLDRYGSEMPALYELREWYLAECDRKGQQQYGTLPWSYDVFDNGEPVGSWHRRLYRDRPELQRAFPHPYSTADRNSSYFRWCEANSEPGVARRENGPGMRAAQAEMRVKELEESLSWRITAPLRWAGARALRWSTRLGAGNPVKQRKLP